MKNITDLLGIKTGKYELSKPRQRKLKLRDINYLHKVYMVKTLEKSRYMEKLRKIYSSEKEKF